MSSTDKRDQEVRRQLSSWFAEHAPEDRWRDVVTATMATTAVTPQRRIRWWSPPMPRPAWVGAVATAVSVGLIVTAGAGLALLSAGAGGALPGRPAASPPAAIVHATPSPSSSFPSGPHLYWANNGISTVGAATLDGSWFEENLIGGAHYPCGVAADVAHVYWANAQDGTIGRANLDGTAVDQHFITGATSPCGVAVDAGHIYWANGGAATADAPSAYAPQGLPAFAHATTIGRANLDGSGVDERFISGANDPCGVAVDRQHVYWLNSGGRDPRQAGATIGRASLDGSGADQRFISAGRQPGPCGIAVDAAHVYWTSGSYSIGRADLAGTAANPAFLTTDGGPCGIAVDQQHLYSTSAVFLGITRAGLDGSGANPYFLQIGNPLGYPYACGVAVGP